MLNGRLLDFGEDASCVSANAALRCSYLRGGVQGNYLP